MFKNQSQNDIINIKNINITLKDIDKCKDIFTNLINISHIELNKWIIIESQYFEVTRKNCNLKFDVSINRIQINGYNREPINSEISISHACVLPQKFNYLYV